MSRHAVVLMLASLGLAPAAPPALASDAGSANALSLPLNPAVTQATIGETICLPGWTSTVRPFVVITKAIKSELIVEAGASLKKRRSYQLDHIIPLELGGAILDRRNFTLQPIREARRKDAVEACLSSAVCQGLLTLEGAQRAIWTDWRDAATLCDRSFK